MRIKGQSYGRIPFARTLYRTLFAWIWTSVKNSIDAKPVCWTVRPGSAVKRQVEKRFPSLCFSTAVVGVVKLSAMMDVLGRCNGRCRVRCLLPCVVRLHDATPPPPSKKANIY